MGRDKRAGVGLELGLTCRGSGTWTWGHGLGWVGLGQGCGVSVWAGLSDKDRAVTSRLWIGPVWGCSLWDVGVAKPVLL